MQLNPKFGPAQQVALRARFWPLPLISGTLHAPIDASEATWHLDTNNKVTIDLPKMDETLWPGVPPVFTSGPGPLAEYQMPALPCPNPVDEEATGDDATKIAPAPSGGASNASDSSKALIRGVAPEAIVQKMGQRPNDLPAQLHGCQLLCDIVDTDPGKALGAANARALPVVLRLLRYFGHRTEVQLAAWRALITLVEAQPFLKKILVEQGGMKVT